MAWTRKFPSHGTHWVSLPDRPFLEIGFVSADGRFFYLRGEVQSKRDMAFMGALFWDEPITEPPMPARSRNR